MLGFNSQRVPLKLGCIDFSVMASLQDCFFYGFTSSATSICCNAAPLSDTFTGNAGLIDTKTETDANFSARYSRFKSEFYSDFCSSSVKSFP